MNKSEKLKAVKEIINNATNAIADIIESTDPKDPIDAASKALQIVVIRDLALKRAQAIATQPNLKGFAGGGLVEPIGEGKQDEMLIPMKTGAVEITKNIMGLKSDELVIPTDRETQNSISIEAKIKRRSNLTDSEKRTLENAEVEEWSSCILSRDD